jgi:hypothetical protein
MKVLLVYTEVSSAMGYSEGAYFPKANLADYLASGI